MTNIILIDDITFYKTDEEGNELLDEITGEVKIFRIKKGVRVKALEYLTEGIEEDMLEEDEEK